MPTSLFLNLPIRKSSLLPSRAVDEKAGETRKVTLAELPPSDRKHQGCERTIPIQHTVLCGLIISSPKQCFLFQLSWIWCIPWKKEIKRIWQTRRAGSSHSSYPIPSLPITPSRRWSIYDFLSWRKNTLFVKEGDFFRRWDSQVGRQWGSTQLISPLGWKNPQGRRG